MGLAFLIIALVDPQSGSKLEKIQRKGIDLMIALDVSNSMLAQDITPNRLERAKQAISKLIDQLDGDRIGIVIFAGKAYTQLPITTDYAAAKLFLSSINTNSVSVQGTAIGEAIDFSVNSFGQSKANKAVIIITDGEDHEGDVMEQAETAVKKGIIIYTIGMGLPDGAPIPAYNGTIQTGFKKDKEGNVVVSRLDESPLQQIAASGKGIYIRANNSEVGLQKVLDDINKIQKAEIDTKQYSDYEDLFQYFIAFSLIFLIFELFVYDKKNQWFSKFKPFEKKLILFIFIITFLPVLSFSQTATKLLRSGNELYEQGKFKEAEKNYRKSLELKKESLKGQFNLGDAVYKQKNFAESSKIFGDLAGSKISSSDKAKVYHNLGNSMLEAKEYDKSIAAYKNSLINNPSDKDTKYNLEYAKMMLRQQQQQKDQDKKDKQDKEKDKQKQDQNKDQQNKDQKQDKKDKSQEEKKISKEDAERMLEALKNDEKKTMQKVEKKRVQANQMMIVKDW